MNYLNHNFVPFDKYKGNVNGTIKDYRCSKCNVVIEKRPDGPNIMHNGKVYILDERSDGSPVYKGILDLTCDEMIVKNIIE